MYLTREIMNVWEQSVCADKFLGVVRVSLINFEESQIYVQSYQLHVILDNLATTP